MESLPKDVLNLIYNYSPRLPEYITFKISASSNGLMAVKSDSIQAFKLLHDNGGVISIITHAREYKIRKCLNPLTYKMIEQYIRKCYIL